MHSDSSITDSSMSPLFNWNRPGKRFGCIRRRNSASDMGAISFVPAEGAGPRAIRVGHPPSLLSERTGSNLRARLVDVFDTGRKRVAAAWDVLVHRGRRESDAALKTGMGTSTFHASGHLDISAPIEPRNAAITVSSVPSLETPVNRDQIKERLRAKLGTMQSQVGLVAELLAKEGLRSSSPAYIKDLPASRFSDISTAAATAVMASDGVTMLAANRIALEGREIAIASQYPREQDMSAFLWMLAEERPSVLVVLASEQDVAWYGLPCYFAAGGTYGDVSVSVCKLDGVTEEGIVVMRYEMTLSRPGHDDVKVPVLHASEWPDHSSLPVAQLQALARMTRGLVVQAGDDSTARSRHGIPVIHCRGGVGRTGQLIGTLALDHAPAMSLETVVTEMRVQRNACMVQTNAQLDTLVDLWLDKGRGVFEAVAAAPEGLLRISPAAVMPHAKLL